MADERLDEYAAEAVELCRLLRPYVKPDQRGMEIYDRLDTVLKKVAGHGPRR